MVKNLELGMESKTNERKQIESKKKIADAEVRRTDEFSVSLVPVRQKKSMISNNQ